MGSPFIFTIENLNPSEQRYLVWQASLDSQDINDDRSWCKLFPWPDDFSYLAIEVKNEDGASWSCDYLASVFGLRLLSIQNLLR